MNLAKQHLDVGLFSTTRDEQLAFWQQTVGLPYDHMGKLGGGMQQHRHHMNGSILKMCRPRASSASRSRARGWRHRNRSPIRTATG
jgi:lactoylglutathione lyase